MRRALVLIVFLLAAGLAHAESFGGYKGIKAGWTLGTPVDVTASRALDFDLTTFYQNNTGGTILLSVIIQDLGDNITVPRCQPNVVCTDAIPPATPTFWMQSQAVMMSPTETVQLVCPNGAYYAASGTSNVPSPSCGKVAWYETVISTSSGYAGVKGPFSWKLTDISGTYATDTVYQNTTSYPQLLSFAYANWDVADSTVTVKVGPTASPVGVAQRSFTASSERIVYAIVPPSFYFDATCDAAGLCTAINMNAFTLVGGSPYRGVNNGFSMAQSADLGPSGTAARAYGTTYQNTTGGMLFYSVTASCTAGKKLSTQIGPTNTPPTISQVIADAGAATTQNLFGFVGVGNYYKATTEAGCTGGRWIEWTFQ